MNITPEYIKNYIETLTELELSSNKRNREIVETRWVAFKLTKMLTRSSLSKIGKVYNKDHATVLHGIKTFDSIYNQADFVETKNLYKRILKAFLEIQDNIGFLNGLKENIKYAIEENTGITEAIEIINFKYEIKIEEIVEKHNKIVTDLKIQNQRFLTNPMFEKICKLPEREFQDLEVRFNAFFQMNAMNEQRKQMRNVV